MMMSPKASRLADASGALVPDASRHRLFTSGGQAPGGRPGTSPPRPPAAARPGA